MGDNMRTHKLSTTGNIASSLAPGTSFQLEEVNLHLNSTGGATNFTVTVDAAAGAAYDRLIFTQLMTTATDIVWKPGRPLYFEKDDQLDFAWTNGNSRTAGMVVYWRSSY